MIVITDGQDSSDVAGAQQRAAGSNITVFAVGVGAGVQSSQLIAVAGDQSRAYNAMSFDFLMDILKDICDNLGRVPGRRVEFFRRRRLGWRSASRKEKESRG